MTIDGPRNLLSELSSERKTRNRCLGAQGTFSILFTLSKIEGRDFREA
jgi:hypothetical protein